MLILKYLLSEHFLYNFKSNFKSDSVAKMNYTSVNQFWHIPCDLITNTFWDAEQTRFTI
jgi:hypothetical protein